MLVREVCYECAIHTGAPGNTAHAGALLASRLAQSAVACRDWHGTLTGPGSSESPRPELRPHIARSFDRLRTVLHISCCAHAAGTSQLKRSGPIEGARCNQGSMKVTFRSKAATAAARTSGGMPFRRPSKCSSTGVLPE